jgi:hypothetical protein
LASSTSQNFIPDSILSCFPLLPQMVNSSRKLLKGLSDELGPLFQLEVESCL